MSNTGAIIRKLRKSRKVSQFELEAAIGAGFGSISKIELGKVEASKQTLIKIVEFLKLAPHEVSILYSIDLNHYRKIISSINSLYAQKGIEDVLQTIVDEISSNLGYIGVSSFLIEENYIVYKTVSKQWFTSKILAILGSEIRNIRFNLEMTDPTPQVVSVLNRSLVISSSLSDCMRPCINSNIADIIQRIVGLDRIAYLPIISSGSNVLGLIGVGMAKDHPFEEELPILYGYLDAATCVLEKQWGLEPTVS